VEALDIKIICPLCGSDEMGKLDDECPNGMSALNDGWDFTCGECGRLFKKDELKIDSNYPNDNPDLLLREIALLAELLEDYKEYLNEETIFTINKIIIQLLHRKYNPTFIISKEMK
jgi:hypothetical protein